MNRSTNQQKGLLAIITLVLLVGLAVGGIALSEPIPSQAESDVESALLDQTTASEDEPNIDNQGESTEQEPSTPYPTISLANVPILTDEDIQLKVDPIMQVGQQPSHQLQTYEVQRGDTPNRIAERFGIKPETLLGGNSFLSEESSLLQAGIEVTILPVDGVLHEVQFGDTLESISELYGIPVEEIIAYGPNNLEFPYRLYKGSQLLVPGAVRELFVWTPPKITTTGAKVVGTGTFIQPVRRGCVTQYFLPWHGGLDIGLPNGTPIYAMDTGTVTYASWASGSYYDYGNLIVIDHGNGFETFYAHLSGINVFPGQVVRQGAFIGSTGNSGRSSGPHIHVEIRLGNVQDDPTWYIQGNYAACG